MLKEKDYLVLEKFSGLIREMSSNGENPATSGNFSYKSHSGQVFLSESGVDKVLFTQDNFIPVDEKGTSRVLSRKASDETLIHLWIFNKFHPQVILHSHMLESLLFADFFPQQKSFSDLEILKAFPGILTHEINADFLVVDNLQDIKRLVENLESESMLSPPKIPLILIRRHGFYTWGKNLFELRKHLEATNYLFRYYTKSYLLNKISGA